MSDEKENKKLFVVREQQVTFSVEGNIAGHACKATVGVGDSAANIALLLDEKWTYLTPEEATSLGQLVSLAAKEAGWKPERKSTPKSTPKNPPI